MDIYRRLIALCLAFFVTSYVHAGIPLARVSFPELKLSIEIPQGFTRISDEKMKADFSSDDDPQVVFSNENSDMLLSITAGRTVLTQDSLNLFKKVTMFTMSKFNPTAEAATVDSHKGWLISFSTPYEGENTATFNRLLVTSRDDKAVQVLFNMPKSSELQYQEMAKASLLSLRFDQ